MEVKLLLRDLFALTGRTVAIDWDVNGSVTADYQALDFEETLQRITRQVDSTYQIESGAFRVRRRVGDFGYYEPKKIERKYLIEGAGTNIHTLHADSADIRMVLKDLSTISDIRIEVDPEVKGEVTMQLVSVRFDVALALILRQANATYTRGDGGIVVKAKK